MMNPALALALLLTAAPARGADYEADARRAHGSDERIGAADLRRGLEFFHRLVLELAARRDY